MSKKGSEKETIFTLFLLNNLSILEKELGLSLSEVVLEESFDITVKDDVQKKKVLMLDMYAKELNSGVEIIIENMLRNSDDDHKRRLLKIIERLEKGIIIYQALGFREKDVKELTLAVAGKDISLYFIQINPKIIPLISKLDEEIHKLKVYENLNLMNIPEPIRLLREISVIKEVGNSKVNRKQMEKVLSEREKELEYLLEQLKERIPYFFPFQKRKTIKENNCILQFGAGKSGVTLVISPKSKGKAIVELRFKEDSPVIYKAIKEKEQMAREMIGDELVFTETDYKIMYHFEPFENSHTTVERLVQVTATFIQAFSNYTFYWDRKEMWGQHTLGI